MSGDKKMSENIGGVENKSDSETTDTVANAVEKAVAGLKANRDEILKEKKVLSDSLKKFDGIDPDKMRDIMANIGKSEETKLITEGKLEEVWDLRSSAMQKHFDSQLTDRDTKISALSENENVLKKRLAELSLNTVLRKEASDQKLIPEAIDDAVFLGRSLFTMLKDGSLAIVDNNGFTLPGADGKTALQPKEWLQGLKTTKPHWWAQSSGAGVTGGSGNKTNGISLSRNRFDDLSQGDRSKFINSGGVIS